MLQKFLRDTMVSIAGRQAEPIVDLLNGKKYINEFLIAKKLNLTINQTRNILYKISDYGLVSSIRKKDKKKGWYTYFWKLEILKCLEFLRAEIIKKIEQINHQIKSRETKEFYICQKCNIEFNEENALIHNFACNECGEIMSRKDNTSVVKEYNKELDKLRRELVFVDEGLRIEKEKIEKSKAREMLKQEKLKKEKRKKTTKKVKTKPKKKVPVKKKAKKSKPIKKKPQKKKTKKIKTKPKKKIVKKKRK
jgi:transcription factor E